MKDMLVFAIPTITLSNTMNFSCTILIFAPLVLTIVTIRTNAVTTDFSNADTSSIPNEVTKSILRLWVHKGRKDFITFQNRNFEHFYLFWFRWILALLVSELLQWIWQNLDWITFFAQFAIIMSNHKSRRRSNRLFFLCVYSK